MYSEIMNFLGGDNSVYITKLRKQLWKHDAYNYSSSPRPDYGLLLLTHGEIVISTQNEDMIIRSGDIVFLPKNLYYSAVVAEEAEDYLINFDISGQDAVFSKPYKLLENAPLYCTDKFLKVTKEPITKDMSYLRLRGLFYLLVDSIASAAEERGSQKDSDMDKARTLLEDEKNYKISEIAKQCGMSESALRKAFRMYYGNSPAEYRLIYRIDRAKYLLESTDMSLEEISNRLSFYDSAYFCKTFKEYTGLTPKQYSKTKSL